MAPGPARFGTTTAFERVVYASHSGSHYGTERMALATLDALRDRGEPLLLAPAGEVHARAAALGIESRVVRGRLDQVRRIAQLCRTTPHLAFFATSVTQSLAFATSRRLHGGGRTAHLHVVHGGISAAGSYGNKRFLLPLDLRFVAVSEFVSRELQRFGVPASRVDVVRNCVSPSGFAPRRRTGMRRLLLVSRLDPNKRVDLLLQALDRLPRSDRWQVDILGGGSELDRIRDAARAFPKVTVHGYRPDVPQWLAEADLLVHTCPDEPFGLAVAEAMAAGVPVLVPDTGGTAEMVVDGVTGFRYRAGSPTALASRLIEVEQTATPLVERIAAAATAWAAAQLARAPFRAGYLRSLAAATRVGAPRPSPSTPPAGEPAAPLR